MSNMGSKFINRVLNREPIRLWWSNPHFPNFGDMLTPIIIDRVFRQKCEWSELDVCDMVGIGSIIEKALTDAHGNNILVWGSGFIAPKSTAIPWGDEILKFNEKDIKNFTFYAVRGELTLNRVGKKYANVPLGDPGLLTSIAIPAVEKTDKIGVVPHWSDFNDPRLDVIRHNKKFLLINPVGDAVKICQQISSCRAVISSSLHGMICADSYGIPNAHMPIGDFVGEYKFMDYDSSIGRQQRVSLSVDDLNDFDKVQEAINQYEPIAGLSKIQKRIIHAFPYTKKNYIKRCVKTLLKI